LTDHFRITSIKTLCNIEAKSEFMTLYFEELNILPEGYSPRDYESKGFVESKLIQDFPLRGKPVFIKLKKRRWRNKITGVIIKRDYSFIADGSKFTQELSDFLKDASRYAA
jgi:hypothetical protein